MVDQAARQPKHHVAEKPVGDWAGPQYVFGGSQKERTVVATFGSESAAAEKMTELAGTLPANAAVRRVSGPPVLRFPEKASDEANKVFDTISTDPKTVYMQSASQGTSVHLMAIGNGEEEVAALEGELNEYLQTAGAAPHEIPPWEANRWATSEEYG